MTEKAVEISITIKVKDEVIEIKRKMKILELELELSNVTQEIGTRMMVAVIEGIDRQIGR